LVPTSGIAVAPSPSPLEVTELVTSSLPMTAEPPRKVCAVVQRMEWVVALAEYDRDDR
jgi:hypothetical protein